MGKEHKRNLLRFSPLLAILPLAANFACNEGSINNQSPTLSPSSRNCEKPVEVNTTLEDVIEKARQKDLGIIVFSVVGYSSDWNMLVKFTRVDIPQSKRTKADDDCIQLNMGLAENLGDSISAVFAATSCSGEYQLSISLDDGQSYTILPVPDIKTRIPRKTFTLAPDSCIRPVTIDFKTPSSN